LTVLLCWQDGASWNKAIKPKAQGGWNLHDLSLQIESLEQFVVFSSVVSSIGHQGEAFKHAITHCVTMAMAIAHPILKFYPSQKQISQRHGNCVRTPGLCKMIKDAARY
jgi:hypothetical protein